MSTSNSHQLAVRAALPAPAVQASNSGVAPAAATSPLLQPQPELTKEEIAEHFEAMGHVLEVVREEIKSTCETLAPRCTDANADDFINGLCQLDKQASSLKSWLVGAQLSIRLNQTLNTR